MDLSLSFMKFTSPIGTCLHTLWQVSRSLPPTKWHFCHIRPSSRMILTPLGEGPGDPISPVPTSPPLSPPHIIMNVHLAAELSCLATLLEELLPSKSQSEFMRRCLLLSKTDKNMWKALHQNQSFKKTVNQEGLLTFHWLWLINTFLRNPPDQFCNVFRMDSSIGIFPKTLPWRQTLRGSCLVEGFRSEDSSSLN